MSNPREDPHSIASERDNTDRILQMSDMLDMPLHNISVELHYDAIRVKFCGLMHLNIKRSALLGIQSWRHGDENYFIQFTMDGGAEITSDYDDVEKWKAILIGLEKIL